VNLERASGVVLRTRLLTETSLIVHWLTAEQGRLATVARGARRPKSPFRGKLDLFYEAEFSFQRSRRSELHALREVQLTDSHPGLRTRLENLRQAAYAASLIEVATEVETPVPGYHGLLREFLACLGDMPAAPSLILALELKVLGESGLQPDLERASLSGVTRRTADSLARQPFREGAKHHPAPAAVAELSRFLQLFLAQHLERVPRGRPEALGFVAAPPECKGSPAANERS
jgi:DNA repair protein RecO (recombination protein O)